MAKKPARPSRKVKTPKDQAVKPFGDLPPGTKLEVRKGADGKVEIVPVPLTEPLPEDEPAEAIEAARAAKAERRGEMPPVPEVKRPKLPGAGDYTPEKASRILERLAEGEGLHEICRDEDMPAESTVRKWAVDDEYGFGAQYMRARDIGLDCRADRLRDTARAAIGLDAAGVNAHRLVVDTEKWYLSKIAPKRYGDRLDLVVDDKRPDTPEARKARIAELIALGVPDDAPAAGV
jgi:hypothetical protein